VIRPLTCGFSVELVGRYSNPLVQDRVGQTAQAVAGIKIVPDRAPVPPMAPRRHWRLVDRLGERVILDLVHERRRGTTQRTLAARYGISLSSVKRILRHH